MSGCSAEGGVWEVQVSFPSVRGAVLAGLNRQRLEGQLCDLAIEVQGQVFHAHRCVLAASSPYFHDQVLLKKVSSVCLPSVLDPGAVESVLSSVYTGRLAMLGADVLSYLTVASVLQLWHIVDKCTELLRGAGGAGAGLGGLRRGRGGGSHPQLNPGCISSSSCVNVNPADSHSHPPALAPHALAAPPISASANRPGESQSPSSSNYFSPREVGSSGAGGALGGVGGGAFLIEEDEEEEERHQEEEVMEEERDRQAERLLCARRREPGGAVVEPADSVGGPSCQDGDAAPPRSSTPPPPLPLQRRPAPSRPRLLPHRHWVVVKTERPAEEEVIEGARATGGAGPEDEEDEEEEEERERERELSISDVRTLSGVAELHCRAGAGLEAQVDFCESSSDYIPFDPPAPPADRPLHAGHHSGLAPGTPAAPPPAPAAHAQLLPLDMQGNQILLYSQAPPPAGPASPPGTLALKGVGPVGAGLVFSMECAGAAAGAGAVAASSNSTASGSRVFMCHCGKSFTHKSMRDRHVNMHLNLRPFGCPICAKRFKMKHHLTEHMKTHTGLKPYRCPACQRQFMWRDSYMRHRAHCDRRGGGAAGPEAGAAALGPQGARDGGGGGPADSEGGGGGIPLLSGGGGRAAVGDVLLVSPQHGVGGFGGARGGVCGEDDVCKVGVRESDVT
ncbi:zinc finger and BTB domain-containing protein 22b [Amia ocellicauda]|uniref:zinc finger and BTB domain-containing protein 22b n=1 Tax=Amia ocellicauda TaxID=2972642 RepID=UPI0034644A3B